MRGNTVNNHFSPQSYKKKNMLNSGEHEILNAHKYENIKKKHNFSGSVKARMLFSLVINVFFFFFFINFSKITDTTHNTNNSYTRFM